MDNAHLLKIENLDLSFQTDGELQQVLKNVSFELKPDEFLGIVGESGSGKSVTALSIMGLLPKASAKLDSGIIQFEGQDLLLKSEKEMQVIRGNEIAMIFQEPMSSLNPSMRCGEQVAEILRTHSSLSNTEIQTEVLDLFERVKLPSPAETYKKYPHQISGGQKQRVMIAMAIACKPKILIADEPTTALDVTVQKDIINLLKSIQGETGMSVIFITHDLALISEISNRIIVMYRGEVVETGTTQQIFQHPRTQYTRALIASRPSLTSRLRFLPTVEHILAGKIETDIVSQEERTEEHKKLYSQPPLLEVVNLVKTYFGTMGVFGKATEFKAVDDVSFKVYDGETLGLVGESGCGKTTLGKAILHLEPSSSGSIYYKGKDITRLSSKALKSLRKEIQIIFQDPYSSLNPRLTVGEAITEPMLVHKIHSSAKERKATALQLLNQVGLDESHYNRYPHEFSGGQRQRIGIARTIAVRPKLIICDESVSALDISVQAQVLNLLNELKKDYGFTYIFISHDLAVVKYMSDQLMVMNQGKIEEIGEADSIYENPESSYTQKLIDAIPKGL